MPKTYTSVSTINESLEYITDGFGVAVLTPSFYIDMLRRKSTGTRAVPIENADGSPCMVNFRLYWRNNDTSSKVQITRDLLNSYFSNYNAKLFL